MENLQKFIADELTMLDRCPIAAPNTLVDLEAFAKSNQGLSDLLLMQMAMNYGYKLALEGMKVEIEKELGILEVDKEDEEDQEERSVVEDLVVGKEYYFDDIRDSYGVYKGIYKGSLEFTPIKIGYYSINERGYVNFSIRFIESEKLGFIPKED